MVSVIIPTYNRSQMLREALESVVEQTYADLEVIVVDDGSTDDSEAIVKAFNDQRVRYFKQANSGVSSARNRGLDNAKGEYICFLDSDDMWPANFLEVMIGAISKKPEYSIGYCQRTLLFPDGSTIQADISGKCGSLTEELFKKSFIQTSTICFRSEVLDGLRFEESIGNSEDGDLWLRASTKGKFLFVPELSVVYREGFNKETDDELTGKEFNRIRVLERFYFRLGGDKYVSKAVAYKKLSHAYRSVAKKCYKLNRKTAAVYLLGKAASYCPSDVRLCFDKIKSQLLSKKDDPEPNWQMPADLGDIVNHG